MLPPALDLATLTPTATRPPATPTVCALSEFFDCAVMLTSCAAFSVAPPPRYDSTVDVPVAVASAPAPAPPMLTAIDVATESVFEIVSSDDAVMLTPPPVDFRLTLSAKALTLLSAVFFAIETPTEAPIRPTDIDA